MKASSFRGFMFATAGAMVVFGGAGGASQAHAADAAISDGATVETLVVTARRRSEALLEVPASVTALSGEVLRDSGITELRDVMALVPNAVIQDSPESFNTVVNIRGMQAVDVQAEPNVGLYRNGMYVGGHRANLGAMVDVERVEILRGPQGGLYGRSSVGGTVDIVYATPTRAFEGYGKASYGSYSRTEVEGAVNIPIGDNSALRLTAWSFNQAKSELFNETLSEYVGAFTDAGIRVGYTLDITDRLNVLWMLENQEGTGPSVKAYAPYGVLNGGVRSQPETVDRIRRDTRSDAKKRQIYLTQAINYRTDYGDLTLNASYRDYNYSAIQDLDHTNLGPEAVPTAAQNTMLRVEGTKDYFVEGLWTSPSEGRLTWMAGVSYFKEKFDFARTLNLRGRTPDFGIQTVSIGFPKDGTTVTTETTSMFATVNYDVTPALSLEASLRYSNDKKTLNFAQGLLPVTPPNPALEAFFAAGVGRAYPTYLLTSENEVDNWSPSLTARYKFNEDLMVFALYSTGFRPGAFNLSPTTPETIPYGQETAKNYELGMKGRFFDGRVDANVSAFYMRQEDMLVTLSTQLAGVERNYLANAGSADTYGVELEMMYRPNRWVSGGLAVGYLHPRFDQASATDIDLSGKLIPYNREWTVNVRVDADYPVSDMVDLIGSASLRYETGGVLGDYYVIDPYETMTKIDLSAGIKYNKNTRITAYVENLLDEHISLFWYYNRATNTSQGRTVGVEITQKF